MKEDYLEDYMNGKLHKHPMFFFKVTGSQYEMLVDQGILSKKSLPILGTKSASVQAQGADGEITNLQFKSIRNGSNECDDLIESSEMQLVEDAKPKKLPTVRAGGQNSPKRRLRGASPEKQVDLTHVLETITDRNELGSVKNSTSDNYYH